MITNEFLNQQIKNIKELANFESTLAGFASRNGQQSDNLASFLVDKHFDL